jgi:2',3'-cyclic-nucleotide 2'-phosphodiesterase (5'-nucleotidase family)
VKKEVKNALLLDSGDLLFKRVSAPIPQNEVEMASQKAYLVAEIFNRMAYDAVGVGEDDLILGKDFLIELAKKTHLPVISSNLFDEATGKAIFPTYLVKEVNGLRFGIFSLLSPELAGDPPNSRKKGVVIRDPVETARAMIQELKPKTDWIILLSHLSYPRDMEFAKAVQGVNFIIGGHTGINLSYPPFINNTLIVQTGAKGMLAGRLDLAFYNSEPFIYNTTTRRQFENNLRNLKNIPVTKETMEAEKAQRQKSQQEIERALERFKDKNEYTNFLLPLAPQMIDQPDIEKMIEAFKAKYQPAENPPSPAK